MVDIAQLVSASDCGSEGRGFESHYPPHKKEGHPNGCPSFLWGDLGFELSNTTVQWTVVRRVGPRRLLTVFPSGTSAPNPIIPPSNKSIYPDVSFFLEWNGIRTIKYNSPVDCCSPGRAPAIPYKAPTGSFGNESHDPPVSRNILPCKFQFIAQLRITL